MSFFLFCNEFSNKHKNIIQNGEQDISKNVSLSKTNTSEVYWQGFCGKAK